MPLREQMTFDPGEGLVRVIVGLLDQAQLLSLRLVEARLHAVCLFETFQRQDEELCVVLVGEGREGDGGEPPALEPMNCGRVDRHRFFRRDVGTVLEGVILTT